MKFRRNVEVNIMEIGKTIAQYRKLRNLTQSELAAKLGVTQSQIAHWETGRSKPKDESVQQIADAFEVDIEELLSGGPRSFESIGDSELKALLFQVARLSEQQQQALKIVLADMVQISQFQAMMEARAS